MTRITAVAQADVSQYTARTAHGTHTLIFAPGGQAFVSLWGRQIKIDNPARFGATDTPQARHAFTLAYVDASASPNGSQAAN